MIYGVILHTMQGDDHGERPIAIIFVHIPGSQVAKFFNLVVNPSATENHPEKTNGPVAIH